MRPYMQIFVLMLSILATSVSLSGQQFSQPLNAGYWTFGLNTGKAYQSSDVKSSASGFGFSLTAGKNLYYKPGATLDFGVRTRLSYNQTKGLNPIRNYNIVNNSAVNGEEGLNYLVFPEKLGENRGFIFSNHKTDLVEAGLEGVVTLNELKEKTGVKVSLYGGLGANIYNVRTDQANNTGDEYFEEYAAVNDRGPVSEINKNLRSAILDGDFETQADGFENGPKVGFMPSVGAEVGFQVTPKFSIDLGHRTTFSGTDLLDGEQWSSGDQDILHYTYMGANFNFNKKEKAYLTPEIIIVQPRDAITTDVPQLKIYATVKNIERAADVELLVNGKPKPFNFRKEKLSATIFLQKGENDVEILAGNFGGEDRKHISVFFQERVIVVPPPPPTRPIPAPIVYRPVVEILNMDKTIREDRFQLKARVQNIEFREDIQLFVNGRSTNFRFDNYRQRIDATVYLAPGKNDIVVRAFNNAGETEDRMIVVFQDRLPDPYVKITQPEPQFRTSRNEVKVVAETEFVFDRRDIIMTVNGREIRHFDFGDDCLAKHVRLEEGRNVIRVRVENETGFSEDKVVVFHKVVKEDLRQPILKILSPKDHTTLAKKQIELIADIAEVKNRRNIELELNDAVINNFTFNGRTLKANLTLVKGSNKITLRATNRDGRDAQTLIVKFKGKKMKPVVKLTTPSNNQTVNKKNITIKGQVTGTKSVDVFVNNVKLTNVSVSQKAFTATAKLKIGKNKIKVKATNGGGEAEEIIHITFKKKVVAIATPVIEIMKPSDRTVANKRLVTLEAKVLSADKVEILLNDKKFKNHTFNGQILKGMLNLKKGRNTVVVKATNKGGTTTESITIVYRENIETPVKEDKTGETVIIETPTPPTKVTGVGTNTKVELDPNKPVKPVVRKPKR